MSTDTSIGANKETVPLTASDIATLKRYIFSSGSLLRELAMLPIGIGAFGILAGIPAGLVFLLGVGVYPLFSSTPLNSRALSQVVCLIWLASIPVISFFIIRSFIRDCRRRLLRNAPIRADLASGVKIGEILEIEEALCIQEVEHRGLGYFCRITDGRVFFIYDEGSACWELEDLAEGYRRGVDPRHERFVPLRTLKIWWTQSSKIVLADEFSGKPTLLADGIYEGDFPESENEFGGPTQVHKTWEEIINSYRRDSCRVNWSEVISSVDKQ
jgi:hypothetical protein